MTFSRNKKPFQNTVPELMTYPVPQFEGYASQHRGSLLFSGGIQSHHPGKNRGRENFPRFSWDKVHEKQGDKS